MLRRSSNSPQRMLPRSDECIYSLESADGRKLSRSQAGRKNGRSGPAPAHVSHTAPPANVSATTTCETSGPTCCGSSASADLALSLGSRCQRRLGTAGSTEFRQTWRKKATPLGRLYWAHTASGHRKNATDSTGLLSAWALPAARDVRDGRSNQHEKNARPLNEQALLAAWNTPTAIDGQRKYQYDRHDKSKPRLSNSGLVIGMPHGIHTGSSAAATESSAGLALNSAMSRWLMGFHGIHDQLSPCYASWARVQQVLVELCGRLEVIESADCAATETRSFLK